MKKAAICISFLMLFLIIRPAIADSIYFDDFESGDLSAWGYASFGYYQDTVSWYPFTGYLPKAHRQRNALI